MEDLFGTDVTILNGQLLERSAPFSEDEAEQIVDEMVHSGELLNELARSLKRLTTLTKGGNTSKMNEARRDAWDHLMWVFDLYESPAFLPFDTACSLVQLDSETVRGGISARFGDELRRLVETIVSRFPDQEERLRMRLRHYITWHLH